MNSELNRLLKLQGIDHGINDVLRLEIERSTWMTAMVEHNSLADQLKKLAKQESGVLLAKQMYDAQKAIEEERIRKMLHPLASIRSDFLASSSIKRMMDNFSKPVAATDHFAKDLEQVAMSSAYQLSLNLGAYGSIENARKILEETSISAGLQQIVKSFEATNKHWAIPSALMNLMSPLKAWQEQAGNLSLPVMDWASAATLAKLLGTGGIASQLAVLGINPDGSLTDDFPDREEDIGFSRKTMDLMTLLSFILTILLPIYQEISSAQWQTAVDKKLEALSDANEGNRKLLESLAKLVEKAIVQEASRQETRFVVRDRVAEVRVKPEHGATLVGRLLQQEVVRPISEDGKWIEIEYYHWLHQEYRTGWALKKYFQRVARPATHNPVTSSLHEVQLNPSSLTRSIGGAKGAFKSAEEIDAFIRSERDQWER